MGKMNPFYHLLGKIKSEFKMKDFQCYEIADYIEQNPTTGYEPGRAWLGKFMVDEAGPEYHDFKKLQEEKGRAVNAFVPEHLSERREERSRRGVPFESTTECFDFIDGDDFQGSLGTTDVLALRVWDLLERKKCHWPLSLARAAEVACLRLVYKSL
ncbi:hypothetical protein FOZ60_000472, partial [Perkinsus olseni]